ncbi:coupling protein TraD [mine drainage metagenome]|uniref:Coupling protein TraD n=1 Tax=mine drainage metagenome TaxID=410659 RepID=A0A1J5Q992_9ZZZZ
MKNSDKLPPKIGLGLTVGGLAALIIFYQVAWLLWQIPYPTEMEYNFKSHIAHWCAMTVNDWLPLLFKSTANDYRYYLGHLNPDVSANVFLWRFDIAAFVGVVVGGFIGYLTGKPELAERHVRGHQLKEGNDAEISVREQAKTEGQRSGDGLRLHKQFRWKMPLDRECRHSLVIGATGAGKTTIITPMMMAAIERGDQLVIYDNKGDFTEWVPDAVLLAPWDARSHALDIARDCRNAQQARELAAHLIPAGKDPIWHQATRQILTALIIKLQSEKPEAWTWRDLYDLVCGSHDDLLGIVKSYTPEASKILEAPGKTTQSVLMHLSTNAWLIADLAKAWGDAPPEKRFSVTDWIKGINVQKKVLILQGSANYNELSNAYIQFVFSLATGLINSPEIPKSKKRRLWFYLDEFPQLGKLERVRALLEVGRSKGIRVVLACQDISQIREVYGEHAANSWLGIVGTYIFTRMGSGETANFIAEKVVGYKTIDRRIVNGDETSAPVREKELVIDQSELSEAIGPHQNGVDALLIGFKDALVINWPYTETVELREASVLADWLNRHEIKVPSHTPKENTDSIDKARIKLRKPTTDQLAVMASTGSNITEAGEDVDDMSPDVTGDNHESR